MVMGMADRSLSGTDAVDGRELARLERAARERAASEPVLASTAPRAAACEMCGSADVPWGALCRNCRHRLASEPSGVVPPQPEEPPRIHAAGPDRVLAAVGAVAYRAVASPSPPWPAQ
jgi:hypothetical protein